MTWWVEVRAWQRRSGKPRFVLASSDLSLYSGFRSVYAYSSDTVMYIGRVGSTANLQNVEVYSDELFCDFDNCEPDVLLAHLYDSGRAFDVYWSGGRSWHVHVPLVPMRGVCVPYSQKSWVQRHAPGADLTFYHQSGQFRLPGTLHPSTGKRKELMRSSPGEPLEIPLVTPRLSPPPVAGDAAGRALVDFNAHLFVRRAEGGRRVWAWHLAAKGYEAGLEFPVVLDRVLWWNENFCSPQLPPDSVEAKCREAFAACSKVALRA